jgi:hypothetical protein
MALRVRIKLGSKSTADQAKQTEQVSAVEAAVDIKAESSAAELKARKPRIKVKEMSAKPIESKEQEATQEGPKAKRQRRSSNAAVALDEEVYDETLMLDLAQYLDDGQIKKQENVHKRRLEQERRDQRERVSQHAHCA